MSMTYGTTAIEKHTQNILALAWASLDTPLHEARQKMEAYLTENFLIKPLRGNWKTVGDPKNVFTITGPLRTPLTSAEVRALYDEQGENHEY